jgi:3-hydroxybutyryl-CoA dehydratase
MFYALTASMPVVAYHPFEDARLGAVFSLRHELTAAEVDAFAALSGDISPLHLDDEFARENGFAGRVVHGVLLAGLLSQLVGVHFPGRSCLLQRMDLGFVAPAYVGDLVEASIEVRFVSTATRSVELAGVIRNAQGKKLVRAKIQVGFLVPKTELAND